ncbi:MAG TPA: sulfatase-like hydrolase/transferase [Pirellulales bacterium]|nr:sulfatase-like hydrolase/transferase [Pirellulales bacterium]
MSHARWCWSLAILLTLWGLSARHADAAGRDRPNILVVLCDDLGYGDLGCFGHPVIKTPNVDRLASEGLRLTSCYSAAANCSPARAGLMTGRTPYRVGVYSQLPMLVPLHLRQQEITIATLLKQQGYQTCHVGKWHLNGMFNFPVQPQPNDHGFDHWMSTQNNCLPNHHDPYNFVRNGIPLGPVKGYASQIVADEAIRWLKDRDASKPFFMYCSFHEPHEPIATDPRFQAMYRNPDDPSTQDYYGNVSQMDESLGRILDELDREQLRDNTLVWFTSDNGPARTRWHTAGSAGGLREFKGHVYEGGIRVPGIVRFPGVVESGRTSDVPVSGLDFLPTVCAITGIAPPNDRTLDGANVTPLLKGNTFQREKPLYWQFNFTPSKPKVAMRWGDWKILAGLDAPTGKMFDEQFFQTLKHGSLKDFELYNLANDIGETRDLASSEPEQLAAMTAALEKMYRDVQQEGPMWPTWVDPGYEQKRIVWPDYTAKQFKKK